MHLPSGPTTLVHRAFGGPFGGGCVGFFPPFGVDCTSTTTTSSTTPAEKTTTKTEKAPSPSTKTTVIVSPTVVTSVVVVTSGNTITAGTTFTSGTTVTSVIAPTPTATPGPTDTNMHTLSDTSSVGGSSSSASSLFTSSSGTPQPTAVPNQTITDTETLVLSISPPSSSVLTPPTSSSSTSSTSIPTPVSTQPTPQSSRGMSTGEIAAICIACVSIVAICILIWLAWRRRSARRSVIVASGTPDPEDVQTAPASNTAQPSIPPAAASPVPDSHRMSPDVPEHMEEKRHTISEYSDSGETASSPGSSTALSSFPLLSPGPLTPTDAEPAFAQMRSFRLAWDDPPPTPERRPVSLQSGQGAAYRRSQGGDGYLAETTENYGRSSVYAAYLAREAGRSEVTLGQPPEYSRY